MPMIAKMITRNRRAAVTACACLLLLATTAGAAKGPPAKPPPDPADFYHHTGFDGREADLGAAVVEAIRKAGPENGEGLGFNPAQQQMLGVAVAKAIKTISDSKPYQHETNDALVKAHLTAIQFAKDNQLLEKMVEHEVKVQRPMIERVAEMLKAGGSPELALIALTDRTACFYQLVQNYERKGMTVRWQSPYGTVLPASIRLGQFDLTEKEVHEIFTMPLLTRQANVMGMDVSFSPWQADGWITMTMSPRAATATN
jgi:hypothetical protein